MGKEQCLAVGFASLVRFRYESIWKSVTLRDYRIVKEPHEAERQAGAD